MISNGATVTESLDQGWKIHFGCWLEASVTCCTDVPEGLLVCSHHMVVGDRAGGSCSVFKDLVSQVTHSPLGAVGMGHTLGMGSS